MVSKRAVLRPRTPTWASARTTVLTAGRSPAIRLRHEDTPFIADFAVAVPITSTNPMDVRMLAPSRPPLGRRSTTGSYFCLEPVRRAQSTIRRCPSRAMTSSRRSSLIDNVLGRARWDTTRMTELHMSITDFSTATGRSSSSRSPTRRLAARSSRLPGPAAEEAGRQDPRAVGFR